MRYPHANFMESKEELIERWMTIASAVFAAEDNILDVWFPKLKVAKKCTQEEKQKIADDYLRAIAEEILKDYLGK